MEPVEVYMSKALRAVAQAIDETLKEWFKRRMCFVVIMTEFGDDEGRVNYMSNGNRDDIKAMLTNQLARFQEDGLS